MTVAILINIVAWKVAWLACVLGATSATWVGPVVVAVSIVGHALALKGRRRVRLLVVVIAAMVVGASADGILSALGIFTFPGGEQLPLWMPATTMLVQHWALPSTTVARQPR